MNNIAPELIYAGNTFKFFPLKCADSNLVLVQYLTPFVPRWGMSIVNYKVYSLSEYNTAASQEIFNDNITTLSEEEIKTILDYCWASKKESLRSIFESLKTKWKKETSFHSSLSIIFSNRFHQEIIRMGKEVLPLILKDLETNSGHWFYALREITGIIQPPTNGDFKKAKQFWLDWWKEQNNPKHI